jgi:hypothetical protein
MPIENEIINPLIKAITVLALVITILFYIGLFDGAPVKFLFYLLFPGLKKKKEIGQKLEREKEDRLNLEREKQNILDNLQSRIREQFSVGLDMIKETTTQDEIVRVVNLVAHQVSVACVNQDKFARGEKVEPYKEPGASSYVEGDYSWNERTHKLKRYWSEIRKLAIQALPELEKRMPHFSEFEPLKSYNEEYLKQKSVTK